MGTEKMQTRADLDQDSVREFINFVFGTDRLCAWPHYSNYGQQMHQFASAPALQGAIDDAIRSAKHGFAVALHFPETEGFVASQRIDLDPKSCDGHTFRYRVMGWGLFFLHLEFKRLPFIETHISCNTQKRAQAWSQAYPDMKAPGLWDWDAVKKIGGRLTRKLKKLEKETAQQRAR